MYEEQEKAKEISKIEDIVLPIEELDDGDSYFRPYVYYFSDVKEDGIPIQFKSELSSSDNSDHNAVFCDATGRKISNNLIKEVEKLYQQQEKQKQKKRLFNAFFTDEIFTLLFMIFMMIGTLMLGKEIKKILEAKTKLQSQEMKNEQNNQESKIEEK